MRRRLRHAARRGVDVRLLLSGPLTDHPSISNAGRRYYERLLHNGVRIFEYQPRVLHAKALLCDEWASIGSSNFDRWTLRWNLEANQEIQDADFSQQVRQFLQDGFSDAIEITLENWQRRPWHRRWQERFLAWLALLINRIQHRR